MRKIICILAITIGICTQGLAVSVSHYYDNNDPEYIIGEWSNKNMENAIIRLKVRDYKEDDTSLKIVFGMNNSLGDFTRTGEIINNYLEHRSYTGFSKLYLLNESLEGNHTMEFNVFNAGQKKKNLKDINSAFFVSTYNRVLERMEELGLTITVNKETTINFNNLSVPFKIFEAEADTINGKTLTYEYRTVYDGCIVRVIAVFAKISSPEAILQTRQYVEKYMKFVALKILLDTKQIDAQEFASLRSNPDTVVQEFIIK